MNKELIRIESQLLVDIKELAIITQSLKNEILKENPCSTYLQEKYDSRDIYKARIDESMKAIEVNRVMELLGL